MQSEPHIFHSLLPDESVELITAVDFEREGAIAVKYTLCGEQHTESRFFIMNLSNGNNTVWNFNIRGCIEDGFDETLLNNVPPDQVKHWHITKSSSHLKIVCNNVTVLNFNFSTDHSPRFENEYQVWSGKCTAVYLYHTYKSTPVLALRPWK